MTPTTARKPAAGPTHSTPPMPDEESDGRRRWRVGFYVEVEVDAYPGEASLVAEAACRWPGSWRPPHDPTTTTGVINSKQVTARIVRSEALMVTEATDDGRRGDI